MVAVAVLTEVTQEVASPASEEVGMMARVTAVTAHMTVASVVLIAATDI